MLCRLERNPPSPNRGGPSPVIFVAPDTKASPKQVPVVDALHAPVELVDMDSEGRKSTEPGVAGASPAPHKGLVAAA